MSNPVIVEILNKLTRIEQQRDNMLSALKIISESEICPAVLAQVAINAINEVKK